MATTMTTATITPQAMAPTEQAASALVRPATGLLQILWLASPTLPVGGFSYSEGLEAAVDAGAVSNEASATAWLTDQLYLGLARSDLAVVAQAIPAWQAADLPRIRQLNRWVQATRETQEFRLQTEQMGRSLLEWARSLSALDASVGNVFEQLQAAALSPPTYPVAMACAAASAHAPLRDSLMGYAFGWAENMVQAAIKSVPLGQSAGQRILARLVQEIPPAVDHAISLTDDTRQAFTPMLAILSARHETQYSRLFRS
jgi:urease accessory protein